MLPAPSPYLQSFNPPIVSRKINPSFYNVDELSFKFLPHRVASIHFLSCGEWQTVLAQVTRYVPRQENKMKTKTTIVVLGLVSSVTC